jgi:hypothetical protein
MQEMFSCVDFDAVLKSFFPHRHLNPVEVADSFMELIEEIPIHVCKINDDTVDGYTDSFHVPPPPDFFMNFGLYSIFS